MLCSSSIRGYYFGGTTMEIKDLEKPVKLTRTASISNETNTAFNHWFFNVLNRG